MYMKRWKKPEVSNLTFARTNEDTCYCEAGEVAKWGGPGHGHPHRPPHNGGHCPDKPIDKPIPPVAGPEDGDLIPTFS